jgi:hypothetical protein
MAFGIIDMKDAAAFGALLKLAKDSIAEAWRWRRAQTLTAQEDKETVKASVERRTGSFHGADEGNVSSEQHRCIESDRSFAHLDRNDARSSCRRVRAGVPCASSAARRP